MSIDNQLKQKMFTGRPPEWSLFAKKPFLQEIWDFVGAPLRMIVLPDHQSERLHLTSLRAERMSNVLPVLKGRCLDIGAGDNMLINLYKERSALEGNNPGAEESIGLDVVDWGGECQIVPDCRSLPFPDESFDTVSFIACINHIPERKEALLETLRILKPQGQVVITMIGQVIGKVGHAIWWYSEDKHRDVHPEEVMGMDSNEIISLLKEAGFNQISESGFVYNLNRLYIATKG